MLGRSWPSGTQPNDGPTEGDTAIKRHEAAHSVEAESAPSSSTDVASRTAALMGVGLLGIAVVIYFLPTIVAGCRGHHNLAAITALNVFLGCTFLGWVVALVWALTHVKSQDHYHYYVPR
jgi:hypothetical protein